MEGLPYSESCITSQTISSSPATDSFSEASAIEAAIHGLRSDRLFFEPTGGTRLMVVEAEAAQGASAPKFDGGTAVEVDSVNPYLDFKRSMEEMLAAHGVRGWDWLHQMLMWYLRTNAKTTHGVIVEAFLDLLSSEYAAASTWRHSTSSRIGFAFEFEDESSGAC